MTDKHTSLQRKILSNFMNNVVLKEMNNHISFMERQRKHKRNQEMKAYAETFWGVKIPTTPATVTFKRPVKFLADKTC